MPTSPTTRPITLDVDAATQVSGLLTSPADPTAAYVFAHGAGAGMTHAFMAAVAEGLAERRIATLRFQFPYMQQKKGRPDTPPVAHATVRAAVDCAGREFGTLRLFAGGKSFGGRMTSQAQALDPLPGVAGLVFFGFPLHASGKPSADRAAHLFDIDVPMLFLHGTRDALAEPAHFDPLMRQLAPLASAVDIAEADHSFHVPKRSGRTDAEVLDGLLDDFAVWTQAWAL